MINCQGSDGCKLLDFPSGNGYFNIKAGTGQECVSNVNKCQVLVQGPRKAGIIERRREARKLRHEKQVCTKLFIYLFFYTSQGYEKNTSGSAGSVVILKRTSCTADGKRGK